MVAKKTKRRFLQLSKARNLKGDRVLVPEYQKGLFESHEIFQYAGERAERVVFHQVFLAAQYLSRVNKRMKRMRTIFENL